MKRRWILLVLLFFSIAVMGDDKTCYSVQLISAPKSESAVEKFSHRIDDPSCRVMTIGRYVTIRCGCYENSKEAKDRIASFKKRYKHASIVKSYVYRFKKEKAIDEKKLPSSKLKNSVVTSPRSVHNQRKNESRNDASCYTVQLWSVPSSQKGRVVENADYRLYGCRLMQIGRHLTARCGCFDTYAKAKKWEAKLKKDYRHALVTKSFVYRFEGKKTSDESSVIENQPAVDSFTSSETLSEESPRFSSIDFDRAFKMASEGRRMVSVQEDEESVAKNPSKKDFKLIKKRKVPLHYEYERYLRPFHGRLNNDWDYRYRFGARVSYDIGYVDEADYQSFKYGFRRVRIYHRGSFFDRKLFYKTAFSFTGNNHVKDLYLGWKERFQKSGFGYRLKAGNIKIPQSLEGYTSSKYLTFMERSLGNVYAENRRLGLEVRLNQRFDHHFFTVFGDYYNTSIDEKLDGDDIDHPAFSGRALYTYRWYPRHLLMFGTSYVSQDYHGDDLKLKEGAESVLDPHKYVHVHIKDVETVDKYHVDGLYLYRRFSLQGGYTALRVDARKDRYDFAGYYLQGGYFIRGEGKKFDPVDGVFKRIRPIRNGDLEVAVRYDYIDMNDKDEHGGSQSDYSLTLNWYFNPNTRLMFNYIMAFPDDTDLYDGMYQIIQSRLLFSF